MKRYPLFLLLPALVCSFVSGSLADEASNTLQAGLDAIAAEPEARIGIAVKYSGGGETVTTSNDSFPMMSTFKFPLVLTVLHLVDEGKLSLDQKFPLTREDLPFEQYSKLRIKYPDGHPGITLTEIITDTISFSDNNGCDFLLRLIGGPAKLQEQLREWGLKDINIAASEQQMHMSLTFLQSNNAKPQAVVALLEKFDNGQLISKENTAFLRKIMEETATGAERIKGQLPKDTVVAHKTGSGGRENGVAVARNDIGIITLPDGKKIYIAAYVADSKKTDEENDAIIARAAKTAWDYYKAVEQ